MRVLIGHHKLPLSTPCASMLLALVAIGCDDASKPAVADEFGRTGKADHSSIALLGSLAYGEVSDPVAYTPHPGYRAFKFAGDPGDRVTIDVTSPDGDAVAWLLDDDFAIVAMNDDISATDLDARIEIELPAHPSRTHYVVFRDFWREPAEFVVSLTGEPADVDPFACTVDDECIEIHRTCCPNLGFIAIASEHADAYRAELGCSDETICPAIAPIPDDRIAICNDAVGQCELADPYDLSCGQAAHACPPGWQCVTEASAVDGPGQCRQVCGGLAGLTCSEAFECIDDPTDACDPEQGGVDCGGLCQANDCRTNGCNAGSSCQPCFDVWACVPDGALC